jgi:Uma2 family endonuclease
MSADEYLSLADDRHRYELIDGVICMSPSPGRKHQNLTMQIAGQMFAFAEPRKLGDVLVEVDVRLADHLVYRPDAIFLSAESAARCDGDRVTVAPDVVVEVISPDSGNYDRKTKRGDYERYGVAEYWMVDPDKEEFVFHQLKDGAFVEINGAGAEYVSPAIPGFVLNLEKIRSYF